MRKVLLNTLILLLIAAGVAWAAQSITVDFAHIGGKTYDSTAGNIAGTNVTITGTWPKQTITVAGAGTGDVVGPGSSTTGNCASFGDTTGKLIADAGAPCGGAGGAPATPQGRLTLQSGVPESTTDELAKTTIYYDSDKGNQVPVWNGSTMVGLVIGSDEISLILDATNHVITNLYDVFAFNASGTLTLCAGPSWASGSGGSNTVRGTGAGSTELERKAGIWVNKNALTHCYNNSVDKGSISADLATYLGTFYTTTAGHTGMAFHPAAASGGSANVLGLWNAYNQIPLGAIEQDSTSTWNYGTAAAEPTNNSTSNRITYVDGLAQSTINVVANVAAQISANVPNAIIWTNLDSTSAVSAHLCTLKIPAANGTSMACPDYLPASLGLHYLQQMEFATGATVTFVGGSQYQYLAVELPM